MRRGAQFFLALAAAWAGAVAILAWRQPELVSAPWSPFPWSRSAPAGPLFGPGSGAAAIRGLLLPLAAAGFAVAVGGVGEAVLGLLRFGARDRLEGACAAWVLGLAALGLLLFGVGLDGLFRAPVLWTVLLAAAVAAWRFRVPATLRSALAGLPRPPLWAAGALAVLLAQVAPYWFCPETDQDAFVFHLALPQRYLSLGRIVADPLTARVSAFLPQPADLPNVFALLVGESALARWLAVCSLFAACGFVFGFVRRRAGAGAAWGAVILCLGGQALAATAVKSKNDLAALAGLVGGFAVALDRAGPSTAAAALIGAGLAVKPVGAAVALVWCAVFRRGLGAVALPVMPWLVRDWLITADPVFPLGSPWPFHGLFWDAGSRRVESSVFSYLCFAQQQRGWVRLPGVAVRALLLDWPAVLVLAPLAGVRPALPTLRDRVCAAGWVLAWLAVLQSTHVVRYGLAPVWLLLAWLTASAGRSAGPGKVLAGAAIVLTLAVRALPLPQALQMDDRARFANPWPYLLGGQTRSGYLDERLTGYAAMSRALAQAIPPGRTLLQQDDGRFFDLPRAAVRAGVEGERPLLWHLARESATPAELEKKLLRQLRAGGISENSVLAFALLVPDHPFAWDDRALRLWAAVAARRLRVAWSADHEDRINGAFVVYRLTDRDTGRPDGLPALPGTAAVWARPTFLFEQARQMHWGEQGFAPVERELLRLDALMPASGSAASKLANFHYGAGHRAQAWDWYQRAFRRGYVTCLTLVRAARVAPSPPAARELLLRSRARSALSTDQYQAEETSGR